MSIYEHIYWFYVFGLGAPIFSNLFGGGYPKMNFADNKCLKISIFDSTTSAQIPGRAKGIRYLWPAKVRINHAHVNYALRKIMSHIDCG